jgi:two-component system alkaline phosphatase synthesis response regulator PhoP
MRILLAEDDPNISLITQLCLEKIGGHTVVVKADGDAALQLALREPFDLIILDGMMPKKSGLQVALELQAHGVVGTPIIFLSAKTDEKDIEEFMKLGTGYIPKPFEPQGICARIDSILAAHSQGRAR